MEAYDGPAWRLMATSFVFSPKHRGALDRLPFQGFVRRSGIQVFRLYSRASPGMDRNGKAGLGWGGGAQRKCVRGMQWLCYVLVVGKRQAGLVYNSPKHRGVVYRLPFQGFARRSGIQVFWLYSRPSPVTDRKICGESATHLANRSMRIQDLYVGAFPRFIRNIVGGGCIS
jgi:hypothetical protein